MKIKFLLLLLLLLIPACQSAGSQEIIPSLISSPLTSTPFVSSLSPSIPTTVASLTPQASDRSCSVDDFKVPVISPSLDQPETLIGFQPNRGWLPGENWEETNGVYYIDFDYLVQGYKNYDQHLFVLEKPICRYEDNKQSLTEIKDYIFIPSLKENELIIDVPSFLGSPTLGENISRRLNFKWEMHTNVECTNAPPRAIMLATYNINELPDKIEPGTQLSVVVFRGWSPDLSTNRFIEFSETEVSCIITFHGY